MMLPLSAWTLLLVCVGLQRGVESFSNGSVAYSCVNLLPVHGSSPQVSSPPYKVSVSSSFYKPGDRLTVTLEGVMNSMEFQGFMLQASEVGGQAAVGCFMVLDSSLLQGLHCYNRQNSTISHTTGAKKTKIVATWMAPVNSSLSKIHFSATFVKDYSTFWTWVNSSTVTVSSSAPSSMTWILSQSVPHFLFIFSLLMSLNSILL